MMRHVVREARAAPRYQRVAVEHEMSVSGTSDIFLVVGFLARFQTLARVDVVDGTEHRVVLLVDEADKQNFLVVDRIATSHFAE